MIYLKSFSELSKGDAAIAGGKGASLGEMTKASIPVPPGFVVLASTFDKFLELAGIDADIDAIIGKVNHQEIHTVEQASKEIQAIIFNSSIPEEVEFEIKTEFKNLDAKYVAVRSSATAEDSSSAAWAGQLDSFLNTNEENLLDNVKKCWASLFTPRAIFYRFEKELHNQKISVAVVVQKMVESEVSGIAFSVHPVTEDYNQIIIEAGFGLGEAIVSGQITPDSYVVAKDSLRILDKNIYTQERGIYRSKDNKSNDWVNIQNKKGSLQCLSDEHILELSKLIIRVENHYGFPCDIEWAMEGGEFYIVQSRPITTLNKKNNIKEDALIDYANNKSSDWQKYWGLRFSFFAASILADYYSEKLEDEHKKKFNNVIIISKDSYSYCFLKESERTILANEFINKFIKNDSADFVYSEMKKIADLLSVYCKKMLEKIDISRLPEFIACFAKYTGGYHIIPRHIIDYSKKDKVDDLIDKLKEIRLYTEQLPIVAEGVLIKYLDVIAKEEGCELDLVKLITYNELLNYCATKQLPTLNELEKRRNGVALVINRDGKFLTTDEDIIFKLEKINIDNQEIYQNEIVGEKAYGGCITGTARIVFDPANVKIFNKGDVLFTGMTRPEYMQLMDKSSAIVTDAGGLLCHAAIIARELKRPCIIGTKIATQIIKDGDEVEVDANNGVVRILKKVIEVKNVFDKSIDDYKIQAEGGRAVCYLLDHIMINQYLVENKIWPLIDINVFSSSSEHSAKWFRLHKGQLQYKEALDRFINKPQLVDELFTYLKSNRDETIRLLNEKEYSKLSNRELADFFGYIISCYYKVLRPSSTIRLVDLGLINKLKEMFTDRDDPNKYLTVSTASEEKSFVLNEEIALLELALEVEEKKLDIENKYVLDKLTNIFNEYCFSELGYYNEKIKTLDEYKKKLLEDVKSFPKERLARINEDFKAFIEQRQSLVKKLSIEEKTVVDIASRLAHVKDVYKLSMNKVLYSSEKLFSEIAERVGRSVDYIKDLSPDEIKSLLNGESINEEYIAKRLASRVVIGFEKTLYVLTGEDADNFKNKYLEIDKSSNSYLGRCASSGHVSGKARIILGPKDFHKMIKGEILVVMNTSPDFTPIMKKAQAIIAEEGGLTAHVSIVSRELGIPSIVGVPHITEILKDGDEVEVDANNGVVKIIKPAK
ncbi:MAG: PEP/pyruvate-binding domain-containing protein [Patescibacteria group bacterium]